MIFFLQMRWNIENRLSFKEVWDLEIEESKAAQTGFKILGMYKVAGKNELSRSWTFHQPTIWTGQSWAGFLCASTWNLRLSGLCGRSRILSRIAARILGQRSLLREN